MSSVAFLNQKEKNKNLKLVIGLIILAFVAFALLVKAPEPSLDEQIKEVQERMLQESKRLEKARTRTERRYAESHLERSLTKLEKLLKQKAEQESKK